MTSLAKIAALILAALALLPAGVAARSFAIDEGGNTSILLDGKLRRALDRAGIEVEPLKPAHRLEKAIVLPVKPEGGFEAGHGAGYAFLRGGIRLRAGRRSVAIKRMVLDTAKEFLLATVAGRKVRLAATDEVKAYRRSLGILVKVGSLRLTTEAAPIIAAKLGRPDVFRPHRLLGRAVLGAPLFTAPVTSGAIHFSLDEGFRQKLESLGVSVAPYGSATQASPALAFSFTQVEGDIDPEFEHGELLAGKEEGLRLVQAGSPPREVIWRAIRIGFENGFGGEGGDVVAASWALPSGANGGMPIGQIEFGSTPTYDEKAAVFTGPPALATLSPYAVQPLNEAFGGGKAVFAAGEPLGGFSFTASVR